jgi:transcriptional regulator with AAA-type ATPase domain
VLCAPVGDGHARGVLYLQGRVAKVRSPRDDRRGRGDLRAPSRSDRRTAAAPRARPSSGEPTRAARSHGSRATHWSAGAIAFARLLEQLASVAPLDVTVLLTGASGTGKSLVARRHSREQRARPAPLRRVNCAALPETLVESELFGALPGAHSTAARRIDGKVTAAEHGTLLARRGDRAAAHAQAKLLQLLQSRTLLSARQQPAVDRRTCGSIAATNADLERAVAERRFRADLFYRSARRADARPVAATSARRHRRSRDALLRARASRVTRLPTSSCRPQRLRDAAAMEWPATSGSSSTPSRRP